MSLLPPIIFGCGASIFLYGSISSLPTPAYFVSIPFWPLFVLPSGIAWKNKVLAKVNAGQFPGEMRSYRQLFLFSKKAVVYELFLNQIGYHSLVGLSFLTYTYYMRKLYDKQTRPKALGEFLSSSIIGFFKLRFVFSAVSLLSEFWITKLNFIKSDNLVGVSVHTKRMLLIKQGLLNVLWMTSVAQLAHSNYAMGKEGEVQNMEISKIH